MKIDIKLFDTIDFQNNFRIKNFEIDNIKCYLINPLLKCQWNTSNLIFRSSIWDQFGYPVSLGYKKFFNMNECPDIEPIDVSQPFVAMEKVDGSCLIISKYRNQCIIRTRGTVEAKSILDINDYSLFENSLFFNKIKKYSNKYETLNHSYIFEYVSPNNKIVINYTTPDFYLTGVVCHDKYTLLSQKELDYIAKFFGIKRPQTYNFVSIDDSRLDVGGWKDREGICIYYNYEQSIRKLKSLYYLKLHSMRSKLTISNLIELLYQLNYCHEEQFYEHIEREFDFEIKLIVQKMNIFKYVNIADQYINNIKIFVEKNKDLSQKDFAINVLKEYNTVLAPIAFSLRRNNKDLNKEKYKLINYLLTNED